MPAAIPIPAFAPPESAAAEEFDGGMEDVGEVIAGEVIEGEVVDVKGPSTAAITITEDVPQQVVLLFPQQKSVLEFGQGVSSALKFSSLLNYVSKRQSHLSTN